MKNTLKLRAPYVIFHGEGEAEELAAFRDKEKFETLFIVHELKDFRTSYTQLPHHARIWNEKLELLFRVSRIVPEPEWLVWADAGFNAFREVLPPDLDWPQIELDSVFPRGKMSFVQRRAPRTDIVGTCFIVHRSVIEVIRDLYYGFLAECLMNSHSNTDEQFKSCGDDQFNFEKVIKKYPNLFYNFPGHTGWGDIVLSTFGDIEWNGMHLPPCSTCTRD